MPGLLLAKYPFRFCFFLAPDLQRSPEHSRRAFTLTFSTDCLSQWVFATFRWGSAPSLEGALKTALEGMATSVSGGGAVAAIGGWPERGRRAKIHGNKNVDL